MTAGFFRRLGKQIFAFFIQNTNYWNHPENEIWDFFSYLSKMSFPCFFDNNLNVKQKFLCTHS
jgi:hypothetical protein